MRVSESEIASEISTKMEGFHGQTCNGSYPVSSSATAPNVLPDARSTIGDLEKEDALGNRTCELDDCMSSAPLDDDVCPGDKSGQHSAPQSEDREKLEEGYIRLVMILPGEEGSLIRCQTRIAPLSAGMKYTALSYAWGPPIAEHEIMLDGRKHMLPKNLWQFLENWRTLMQPLEAEDAPIPDIQDEECSVDASMMRQIAVWARTSRRASRVRSWQEVMQNLEPTTCLLWVDALCIDQLNMQERMHQVKIMSRIFGGADKVIVWLGPHRPASRDNLAAVTGLIGDLSKPEFFEAVQDICGRPYWSRLWIFQELRSARQRFVMCGSEVAKWTNFDQMFSRLGKDSDLELQSGRRSAGTRLPGNEINAVRHSAAASMVNLCGQNTPTSLWLLLQLTKHLHCYDPHDKVYALLSMAKVGVIGIEADYNISLSGLMCRVLSNVHLENPPHSARQVTIQCERLKALMGLKSDYPWHAKDYLATANLNLQLG